MIILIKVLSDTVIYLTDKQIIETPYFFDQEGDAYFYDSHLDCHYFSNGKIDSTNMGDQKP
jgi:hypothetical protein